MTTTYFFIYLRYALTEGTNKYFLNYYIIWWQMSVIKDLYRFRSLCDNMLVKVNHKIENKGCYKDNTLVPYCYWLDIYNEFIMWFTLCNVQFMCIVFIKMTFVLFYDMLINKVKQCYICFRMWRLNSAS